MGDNWKGCQNVSKQSVTKLELEKNRIRFFLKKLEGKTDLQGGQLLERLPKMKRKKGEEKRKKDFQAENNRKGCGNSHKKKF